MSTWPADSILEFRSRAGRAIAALLFTLSTIFISTPAPADQLGAQPGFSLKVFCADPGAAIDALQKVVRQSARISTTDTFYDDIMSGVLWRLFLDCRKGNVGHDVNLNMYVRNSRIDAVRRVKYLEFQDELTELAPPESDATEEDILDVIRRKATTRQQMVFAMLYQGMTQQEIADHIGTSVALINNEKGRIAEFLKTELQLLNTGKTTPEKVGASTIQPPVPATPRIAGGTTSTGENVPGPSMIRVKSPIGAELVAAMRGGAEVLPTGGGHAGPVMTIKIPRSQLSGTPVDGIIMLPVPVILKSDTAGEQEMVAAAAREIGEGDNNTRTFALYAFCKDEKLETPSDLSRYSFKSKVSDPKVVDIVTRGDFRQPEAISKRLWAHYADR